MVEKTRWAIHDAAKFQKLIGHVRDLTDGLMRDAPGPQETHDEKVQNDIASLVDDIPRLRLFSEACEDDYPEWSDTARSAIDASEIGAADSLLANDRLEQYQTVNNENTLGNARGTHDLPTWFGDDKGMIKEPWSRIHTDLYSLCPYYATGLLRIDRAMP